MSLICEPGYLLSIQLNYLEGRDPIWWEFSRQVFQLNSQEFPPIYAIYSALSFRHDSSIEVCSIFLCMWGTPEHSFQTPIGMRSANPQDRTKPSIFRSHIHHSRDSNPNLPAEKRLKFQDWFGRTLSAGGSSS